MSKRFNMAAFLIAARAIFISILAIPFWLFVLIVAGKSPLLSPAFVVVVLIAMTMTIHVPIRRWRNAWFTAALFAGVIAVLSLLIAAANADVR
jgi:hypothetical protein